MDGARRVAVTFFGDGAVDEGVFHESLNWAAVRRLPVVFVCENNLYATHSPLSVRLPAGTEIYQRAAAAGAQREAGERGGRGQRRGGGPRGRAPGGGPLPPRGRAGVPGVHDLPMARARRPARRQRPRLSNRGRDRGLEASRSGDAERADAGRRESDDARASGRDREPDPGRAQRGCRGGAPGALARPERSLAGRVLMRELTYA